MLGRVLPWLGTVANLGRMWVMSRQPHIEADFPDDIGDGLWVAIATARPVQAGEPVYGTAAYRAVGAGQRFWIYLPEGEYWVYAVHADDPGAALKRFYSSPEAAVLLGGGHASMPGFRTELQR